jgi:hypothetical protein
MDPQFKTVLTNYLTNKPHKDVAEIITSLEQPPTVQLMNQIAQVLLQDTPVRLFVAVQQAANVLQKQSAAQKPADEEKL